MPEAEPIVAMPVLLLVHRPPLVASVSEMLNPTHTVDGPPIAAGVWLTVTSVVA
jgi:hypothetical protein